ncbi:diguanylate cyclase domain-containing protein [Roseomonas sp. F4]
MDGLPRAAPEQPSLSAALIDSRARWRDFALLAADMLFETDAEGRLTFLAPDRVLGHDAPALLGTPAAALLAVPNPDPFASIAGRPRQAKAWLRCADGGQACLDFTLMPLAGGLRGVGRDITAMERRSDVAARALRRSNALGQLLRLGQRQGSAEAALEAMLGALPAALACDGAALLEPEGDVWRAVHIARDHPPLHRLPAPGTTAPADHHALASTEAGPSLLVWRRPDQPPLEADDRELLAAMALPLAALRGELLRQRALADAAHGDGLTGLLNRRGFTHALTRHVGDGGALVFIDLDGLKPLNDRLGHAAGDAALRGMAARLREAAAERDLAARLGGDEFCLWLHGIGEAEAACRTARLGAAGPLPDWPEAGPEALRASLGIAIAEAGETVADLIARADAAMYAVKRARGDRRR